MSSARSRGRGPFAADVEVICWSVVCVGVWVLTLSFVNGGDLAFAVLFGVISGGAAAIARRVTGSRWSFDPRWARWLLAAPVDTLLETPAVWWQAVRRLRGRPPTGRMRVEQMPDEKPERAAGRRALVMTLTALTPGSLVIDVIDEQGGTALLEHRLVDALPGWATIRAGRS